MDWLVVKTGALLNSSAAVLDQVLVQGSQFEATLSPAAMKVFRGVLGNDVLSAGFFLMLVGSFYTFFKDLIVRYYYEFVSWFYVSVEVQEGDDCYKWLSGKPLAQFPDPVMSAFDNILTFFCVVLFRVQSGSRNAH